jgi:hypothetical protein
MKTFLRLALALTLMAALACPACAEDYLDFDFFRLTKQEGVTYYTRDSEIADDPRYETTYGYLADNDETFLGAAFNDQYSALIHFYPVEYEEMLTSRDCVIEIFDKCYGSGAAMFDSRFVVYPYTGYLYEVYSIDATDDEVVTNDWYFIFTYDGIIEIAGTSIDDRTSEDYSYNYDMMDFVYDVVNSVSSYEFMK